MSLSWKINKLMPEKEKEILKDMLNKYLRIEKMWINCIYDKSKTDKQCEFVWQKLSDYNSKIRERFSYLKIDSFTIDDVIRITQ